MKFSTYYFHMKMKILADFEICISAPLRCSKVQHETTRKKWNSKKRTTCKKCNTEKAKKEMSATRKKMQQEMGATCSTTKKGAT